MDYDNEDDIIKALLRMRDGWERQMKLGELKAKLAKRLSISLNEAGFLAKQMLNAAQYKQHVGNMVALPFSKALFPRAQIEALAVKAKQQGNDVLYEACVKALAGRPEERKAQLLAELDRLAPASAPESPRWSPSGWEA